MGSHENKSTSDGSGTYKPKQTVKPENANPKDGGKHSGGKK